MSNTNNNSEDSLIYRLRKRAEIRRSINSRKSVQEGKADRISDLLEESADHHESQESRINHLLKELNDLKK